MDLRCSPISLCCGHHSTTLSSLRSTDPNNGNELLARKPPSHSSPMLASLAAYFLSYSYRTQWLSLQLITSESMKHRNTYGLLRYVIFIHDLHFYLNKPQTPLSWHLGSNRLLLAASLTPILLLLPSSSNPDLTHSVPREMDFDLGSRSGRDWAKGNASPNLS